MELDAARTLLARLRGQESGEGVISTAIAVLILAIIGGLMWVLFQQVFDSAGETIQSEVEQIGS